MSRDSGTDSANGGWLWRLVRHQVNDKHKNMDENTKQTKPAPVCPKCGGPIFLIANTRLDQREELIPACKKCQEAFRSAELGWKIEDIRDDA